MRSLLSRNSSVHSIVRCCRVIGSDYVMSFSLLMVSHSRASRLIDGMISSLMLVEMHDEVRGADSDTSDARFG